MPPLVVGWLAVSTAAAKWNEPVILRPEIAVFGGTELDRTYRPRGSHGAVRTRFANGERRGVSEAELTVSVMGTPSGRRR